VLTREHGYNLPMRKHLLTLSFCCAVAVTCLQAADRSTITFADGRIFPESLTSTTRRRHLFRQPRTGRGLPRGQERLASHRLDQTKDGEHADGARCLADEKAGVLWVCTSASGGRNGQPVVGETALKAFSLKDASLKNSYPFPGNGLCNDVAVARDGTVYATDTTQGRVLRLKKGATALDVWIADAMTLATADGIAILADGNVYVNSVGQSTLMRIPSSRMARRVRSPSSNRPRR
jgi:hypothetical protein